MAKERNLTENVFGTQIPYADPAANEEYLELYQLPFPEESSSQVFNVSGGVKKSYNAWWPRWGANTINATVTGILSGLAELAGSFSALSIFDYYKQQEELAIQNATEQARRIQLKGDLILRDLEIKNTLNEGKNTLAVAAAGGNLSGSFLDTLMQNKKHAIMDERTASIQTIWDVSNAKRAGYIQAMDVAGKAMSMGYKKSGDAWVAASAFVRDFSKALLADKRQYDANEASSVMVDDDYKSTVSLIEYEYGKDLVKDPSSSSILQQEINNLIKEDPANQFSMLKL